MAGILLIIGAIIQEVIRIVFDWTWTMINFFSLPLSTIVLIVGIMVGAIFIAIGLLGGRKKTPIDPHFAYLTVWYSKIGDTPDTPNPSQPYFIVNNDTKQAYWVSDLITPYVKKKKFQCDTRHSKKALMTYFKKVGININYRNPEPEELRLIINENGSLSLLPKIIYELKNRTFDDLEIEWLFPWHYHFLPSRFRHKPPNKRLLRKFSTKETFKPPQYDLMLIKTHKITKDSHIMNCLESLNQWSERHGYTYYARRYSAKDLLAEK